MDLVGELHLGAVLTSNADPIPALVARTVTAATRGGEENERREHTEPHVCNLPRRN
jgi:hypothetical protein